MYDVNGGMCGVTDINAAACGGGEIYMACLWRQCGGGGVAWRDQWRLSNMTAAWRP